MVARQSANKSYWCCNFINSYHIERSSHLSGTEMLNGRPRRIESCPLADWAAFLSQFLSLARHSLFPSASQSHHGLNYKCHNQKQLESANVMCVITSTDYLLSTIMLRNAQECSAFGDSIFHLMMRFTFIHVCLGSPYNDWLIAPHSHSLRFTLTQKTRRIIV